MYTFMEYIEKFDPELAELLAPAFTTRGKRKGLVLKTAPVAYKKPEANAVWNAVMSNLSPVRTQIWNLSFMNHNERVLYEKVDKALEEHLPELRASAQMPFEFSLFAHHYDVEKIQDYMKKRVDSLK